MRKVSIYFIIILLVFSQSPIYTIASNENIETDEDQVILLSEFNDEDVEGFVSIDSIKENNPDYFIPDETSAYINEKDNLLEVDDLEYMLVSYEDEKEGQGSLNDAYVKKTNIVPIEFVDEFKEERQANQNIVEEEEMNDHDLAEEDTANDSINDVEREGLESDEQALTDEVEDEMNEENEIEPKTNTSELTTFSLQSKSTVNGTKTSKLARIKNSNVKIYETIDGNAKNSSAKYTDVTYYVKQEVKVSKETYYLLSEQPSATKGTIGWVKATDVTSYDHNGLDKNLKTFKILGNGNARSKAWGASKDIVHKDLANYAGATFNVNLSEKVGENIWYRGKINGKGQDVWLHSSFVGLMNESKTSKLGHIKNNNVKIYENFGGNPIIAGNTYTNAVYYIKKQAKQGAETYYLISTEPSAVKGVVGWVNAKDLSTHNHVGVDKKAKTFYLNGKGKATTKAWGGSKNDVHSSLSSHQDELFQVDLTEKVGNNTWYRGKINGKGQTVWVHSSYVVSSLESSTSKLGHIKNAGVKIYKSIGGASFDAGSTYTNAVYYIKKQAKVGNETFYLISKNPSAVTGVVGWVNAKDLSIHDHKGVDKNSKTFYLKGNGKATTKAWGGKKDDVHSNLSNYKHQRFMVNLTEKVGNNIWYRGKINGKGSNVWIHSSHVVTQLTESNTSRLGHLRNNSVKIYEKIGGNYISAGKNYTNEVYYIKKQAKLDKDTYYLISRNPSATTGVVGWVNAKDLSSHPHVGVDKNPKSFYLNGKGKGTTKAWGGSKNNVHATLTSKRGDLFEVNLTEKVGNNTWYRGKINGKGTMFWVHSSSVTQTYESKTNYNLTYNQALDIQLEKTNIMGNNKPASKDQVAYYLNPANFIKDKKQKFQFLNLSTPNGIPAGDLNKILIGKNTLSGEGNAFANAARTYGINEVYLISHAILETGHGKSELASGVEVGKDSKGDLKRVTASNRKNLKDIKTTYNMFGIGAVDSDALNQGAFTAYNNGWYSPSAAIIGGAKWIKGDYISNQHNQNTLYKMRWNPNMNNGFAWKQYATDVSWASQQADIIYGFYEVTGFPSSIAFDYPVYK